MPKFEVRNQEWGDDSDYVLTVKNSLEEAVKYLKDFNEPHPVTIQYERLYIEEIADNGTRSIPKDDI